MISAPVWCFDNWKWSIGVNYYLSGFPVPFEVDPKANFDYLLTWKIATQFVNRTDTKEPHENTWNATKKKTERRCSQKPTI